MTFDHEWAPQSPIQLPLIFVASSIFERLRQFSHRKNNLIFIKNSIEQVGCSEVFKCVWYAFLSGYQSEIGEFSTALKGNIFFPWDLYAVLFSLLGKSAHISLKRH